MRKKVLSLLLAIGLAVSAAPAGTVYAEQSVIQEEEETIQMTSLELSRKSMVLKKGSTYVLKPDVQPGNATNKALEWTSSDSKIATVDEEGTVTAIGNGVAYITAKAADGSGKYATCKVVVPYSIVYKLNGGKNSSKNPDIYYSKSFTLSSPSRKGYTFKGWYKDSHYKYKITKISAGSKRNYTLYAKWEKIDNRPKATIKNIKSEAYNLVEFTINSAKEEYSYDIFRSTAKNGTYTLIDTVSYYGTSWMHLDDQVYFGYGKKKHVVCFRTPKEMVIQDSTVKWGKTYYYKVRMRNYGEKGGTVSNPAGVKVKLGQGSVKRGYVNASGKVKLDWDQVGGASGYAIYRKNGGTWKKIKTITSPKTLTYTDASVRKGSTYAYKVRAYKKYKGKIYVGAFSPAYLVKTYNLSLKGNYNKGSVYGPYLSTTKLAEVRQAVQSFYLNYIHKGMSGYQKVLTAYQYLRSTCQYAWRGWQYNEANSAWGALIYGEAQCSGYARAMKALCDSMGVPCYYVHANSKSANPSHQWNEVKVGGKWYILDPQGGFFLVSAKTYKSLTGMRWNENEYPKCTSDYR